MKNYYCLHIFFIFSLSSIFTNRIKASFTLTPSETTLKEFEELDVSNRITPEMFAAKIVTALSEGESINQAIIKKHLNSLPKNQRLEYWRQTRKTYPENRQFQAFCSHFEDTEDVFYDAKKVRENTMSLIFALLLAIVSYCYL